MAVYVLDDFSKVILPDGSKAYTLCADSYEELKEMARNIDADESKFNSQGTPFYIISKSKAKLAMKLGALSGKEAKERIRAIKEMIEDKEG